MVIRRRATLVTSLATGLAVIAWLSAPARLPIESGWRAVLAAEVGTSLPIDARLSGGFQPGSPSTTRAPAASPSTLVRLSPDARIAIAELEKIAVAAPTAQSLADAGVAYLVAGDVDRSIATLTEATTAGRSAVPWSDLSAAYLTKAERVPSRNVEYLSRALEAATRALAMSPSNEARFNQALALDRLSRFVGLTAPWPDYLHVERDQRWIDAAKRHITDDAPDAEPRTLWDARERELESRLSRLDASFANQSAIAFPEAVLDYFEQRTLVDWSRSVLRGDSRAAAAATARAALLAAAFERATGDTMAREAVVVMQRGGAELARAHLAYVDGLGHYDQNDYARARTAFAVARDGFGRASSPYRSWAGVQLATIQFQERDLAAADKTLAALERTARADTHATVLARTLWLRGLVYSKQWRLTEALAAFRESAARFEAARQRENAVSLYHHLADTLRTLGEQRESWEYIGRALTELGIVRKPIRRYLFLYNASLFASSQNLFEAALLFQNGTVREAARAGVAVEVDALTQRALIHTRRGDRDSARRDLTAARAYLERTNPGFLRDYLNAELGILGAQLAPRDPSSIASLQQAVTFFDRAEPARIPRLYLALSRAQAASDRAASERSLEDGIQRLERQQASMSDAALKVSYFDESWELFDDMVNAQLAGRQNPGAAFAYAERARARTLLASTGSAEIARVKTLIDVQAVLPIGTALLYYVTLPDRVIVWTITRQRVSLAERAIERDELTRLVERHRAAIVDGRDSTANDRLHDVLIAPVAAALENATSVMLAPDGALQQLPFATLRSPATGRFLIEDRALAYTPSASFLAIGLAGRPRAAGRLASALLVGNPGADTAAALPGAAAEVGTVAGLYPQHVVLTGRAATREVFLEEIPRYEVVHFGGHAVSNPEYPLLSRLLFAPAASGDSESLFAHELSKLRLPHTRVVVLAACSTAVGAVSRGEGVMSVARPFLAAGVPVVVASQWDVDDRATRALFVRFHRVLAETAEPMRALREAQLSLLREDTGAYKSPAHWGAFVALGVPIP